MKTDISRLMIGGTGSGCGKTTVTCAILRVLQKKELKIASFKCGPDYIDPMFHKKVIGSASRNIDMFLCGEKASKYLFAKNSQECDISVIEGVMGFYDGLGGNTVSYSAYDISEKLKIPTILIVDCKGVSLSVAAEIKGYMDFLPNRIAGVILNNLSSMMYPIYKDFIEEHTGMRVLGHMPREQSAVIGSRHLGLVTAGEIEDINAKIDRLALIAEETIDIDGLLEIAQSAEPLEYEDIKVDKLWDVRIAYAIDKAFCFYYDDSLDLLRRLGADLIPFSPLYDEALPENIHGIIIGGGYPELYAEDLSLNKTMLDSIKQAFQKGMPIYAECGGFMYLSSEIDGHPMCGVIQMKCRMTDRLGNFGYIKLKPKNDTYLLATNEEINAHEFHYSISDLDNMDLIAEKASGRMWETGYCRGNLFAHYPHLHFYGKIEVAKKIIIKCKEFNDGHQN